MAKHIYCPKCGCTRLNVRTIVDVKFEFFGTGDPGEGQAEEYIGWDTPEDHAHTECSNCRHTERLFEFMHEQPFVKKPEPPAPAPVLVLGGNAYTLGAARGELLCAPVDVNGRYPFVGTDAWYEVDPFELKQTQCKQAADALRVLIAV